jgi:hypothetical protein
MLPDSGSEVSLESENQLATYESNDCEQHSRY